MSPHAWRCTLFLHFCRHLQRSFSLALASLLLAGCAGFPGMPTTGPATSANDISATVLLDDFQRYQRLSPREASRERTTLTAASQTPATRLRLAMLWGLTANTADLAKASALANGVLKTAPTEAPELHALARLLTTHYQERIKAEAQTDKLAQQLRDSQRRNDELQEKLNAMADIEQSIPQRPIPGTPAKASP